MIKKLLKMLVCAVLMLSLLSTTVFAYKIYPWGEITSDDFTNNWMNTDNHGVSLSERRIYPKEYASFRDGLLLVFRAVDNEGGTEYNYVNSEGEIVDLNRGRFNFMSSFENGIASAIGDDLSAFIDLNGNVVLDTSICEGTFHYGVVMTTRFVDGKTIVHNNGWIDLNNIEGIRDAEAYQKQFNLVKKPSANMPPITQWNKDTASLSHYYVIDIHGNVLETICGIDELIKHPLYKTAICNYSGVPLGVLMNPTDYVSSEEDTYNPPVSQDPEIIAPDVYKRPELPGYEEAQTHFQSKGKITSIVLADMAMCSFNLTVTNDTDYTDSGVIAIVAANTDGTTSEKENSGVFFVPYYLAPHSSDVICVPHREIVHMYMFGDDYLKYMATTTAEALVGKIGAAVVHFEDDDDLWNFYDIVPYEQYWESKNLANEFHPICCGEAGIEFLNIFGINRLDVEYDSKHNYCRR